MCWTKIEVGLVISIFIYSDPVPVFLISMCCFVLSLARAAHFIKWSKWQGRAILESGSFLYHMKTLSACQRCTSHQHKGKYGIAKGVGGKKQRETQWLCQEKYKHLFPWKMTMTYLKTKICIALKVFCTQYLGERHWCGPLKNRSSSLVLQCSLHYFKILGTWSWMGEWQIHHTILTTETSVIVT